MLNTIEIIPCQGLLFDLDGTLVESAPDLCQAMNHVLSKCQMPTLALKQVRQLVGNGARVLLARGFWGADAEPPEGDAAFETAVKDFLDYYRQHLTDTSHPFPGVMVTLKQLQELRLPMAVVTNKPESLSRLMMKQLGMDVFFDCLVGGDTLSERKPHPLPLHHALEKIGVEPALGIMVGDSQTDADAARAAGCPLIMMRYGYNQGIVLEQLHAEALLDDFEQIPSVIAVNQNNMKLKKG